MADPKIKTPDELKIIGSYDVERNFPAGATTPEGRPKDTALEALREELKKAIEKAQAGKGGKQYEIPEAKIIELANNIYAKQEDCYRLGKIWDNYLDDVDPVGGPSPTAGDAVTFLQWRIYEGAAKKFDDTLTEVRKLTEGGAAGGPAGKPGIDPKFDAQIKAARDLALSKAITAEQKIDVLMQYTDKMERFTKDLKDPVDKLSDADITNMTGDAITVCDAARDAIEKRNIVVTAEAAKAAGTGTGATPAEIAEADTAENTLRTAYNTAVGKAEYKGDGKDKVFKYMMQAQMEEMFFDAPGADKVRKEWLNIADKNPNMGPAKDLFYKHRIEQHLGINVSTGSPGGGTSGERSTGSGNHDTAMQIGEFATAATLLTTAVVAAAKPGTNDDGTKKPLSTGRKIFIAATALLGAVVAVDAMKKGGLIRQAIANRGGGHSV